MFYFSVISIVQVLHNEKRGAQEAYSLARSFPVSR